MILGLKKLFRWAALLLTTSRNSGSAPAIGTTAGNAAGTPAALATVGAITAEAAGIATAQIAAAIIITAILCPLLVSWLDKMDRKRAPQDYAAQPAVN